MESFAHRNGRFLEKNELSDRPNNRRAKPFVHLLIFSFKLFFDRKENYERLRYGRFSSQKWLSKQKVDFLRLVNLEKCNQKTNLHFIKVSHQSGSSDSVNSGDLLPYLMESRRKILFYFGEPGKKPGLMLLEKRSKLSRNLQQRNILAIMKWAYSKSGPESVCATNLKP